MTGLFRPEALEAQRQQALGTIHLTRQIPGWVAAIAAVLALGLGVAFLTLGEYTRKARVVGQLVPDRGLAQLLAPHLSTVRESRVAEGSAVRQGDVLFVLDVGAASDSGDVHAAVRDGLSERRRQLQTAARQQHELDASRRAAIGLQLDAMRRESDALDAEASLQQQRLQLAQQALQRLESLRGDQFVSAAQVQTKAEEVLGLQAALQSLQRQAATQRREIDTLDAERRELPLRAEAQQSAIERDVAALDQQAAENDARREVVVRAPHDGVLAGVAVQAGQTVTAGAVLASLLPAQARLQAQLLAPSSAIGFVREQQSVLLRYAAFPYQKFGHQRGEVVQVSRAPLPATSPGAAPMYRITVALDRQSIAAYGREQALAPGMQIEADVLLERRRLIEWIFEPVLGIAGRV